MEMERVDTQHAYEEIFKKIVSLELEPGSALDEAALAGSLSMGVTPVREALKLLAHEDLIVITPRHGLYVSSVDWRELEQLCELRLALEPICARLAAQRATEDDLAVLNALRQAVENSPSGDPYHLFDLDHKFHQAVTRASHNKYMARTLEHYFGLNQRLWFLVIPHLAFLPASVEDHLGLVDAIEQGDGQRAEEIMYHHIKSFYDEIGAIFAAENDDS